MPVGSMPRVKVARHANANAKAPDCGSKSGDVGRSLRAADGVQRCFVRPGEERRTALGLFAFFFLFWRPGFAALQTRGTRDSYASWETGGEEAREGERRGERERLAGWLDEVKPIFVGCDSITPATSTSSQRFRVSCHVCRDCIALSSFTARGMRGDRTAEARPRGAIGGAGV
ncbi:hypothetical protein V8C40DRAFT_125590 [Trichoderma camerunense]